METAPGLPSDGDGEVRAGVLRWILVVFGALVVVLLVVGKLGGQVGTTGLLVLVCVAVLAIALLNRRKRSNR